MSGTGTQLSDSLAGLHRAAEDLRGEAERLAESLRGRNRDLRASVEVPEPLRARVRPSHEMAQPEATPAPELLPQVVAALVPIVAFALVDVHLALAVGVALAGVIFLQVRWWMLAVSIVSLIVLLLIEPGLREGGTVDKVAAIIVLFSLMAFALVLQDALRHLRQSWSARD